MGVIVSEEFIDKVVEVTRVSERLMMVKLIVGKCLMNVVAAYAPQTGRSQEEKDNLRYEEVHGGQGYGMRNAGERILEFCEAEEMIVWHTV